MRGYSYALTSDIDRTDTRAGLNAVHTSNFSEMFETSDIIRLFTEEKCMAFADSDGGQQH